MLIFRFSETNGVLEVEPKGELSTADFEKAADFFARELVHNRKPCGLLLLTREFSGWKDLSALAAHVAFLRDHHRFMRRVAVVSDDITLRLWIEKAIKPLLAPEVRMFGSENLFEARKWLCSACECGVTE